MKVSAKYLRTSKYRAYIAARNNSFGFLVTTISEPAPYRAK